ncbi:two-component regulator propeller domain-containing protein [uncultured Proteiniphilum sp.]|uniref:hybrid sensor histidine kinase/response regulator transcription factor n=1 Tax=uncultured Proteiniphilum sp. TaxID=497637 RepID=UPI002634BA5B|nr:two-component regulator propeller domain-containing protein [uncultured Proteiniphilum sp.]
MIRLFTLFVLLWGMIFFSGSRLSGSPDYTFTHYNINNGLSQNTVRSIFQDNRGFMWFGTKDGLNRFDGTSFKVFKFSPESDLNDNVFHRILQDKNDNIWVATENGVYIYDVLQEKFYRFNKTTPKDDYVDGVVTEMIADHDGDIWMSVEGKGIYHYNIAGDVLNFYTIPLVEDGLKMVSLCPDNNRGVWVFPYSSLFLRIDKKTGEVTPFHLVDDKELFYHVGEVLNVIADRYNYLLLATSQKGVIGINTINRTHRILLSEDAGGEPVFARCIRRVDPNTLWIGTESGIYIYDTETEEVTNLRHNNSMPYSLSDNAIYSIYKDRDGGIWVGTYFGGVNYYANRYNSFDLFYPIADRNNMKGRRVREFCSAPDGKIWIGTEDGGLNLFDPVTDTFQPLPLPLRSLYTNIHALLSDGDYLWIGSYSKGLVRYNTKSGELITYTQSDTPNTISQNSPFALCKDRQGLLWVGTLSGVDTYDYEKDHFRQVKEMKGMSIMDIFEDSYGLIWISTFLDGLYRFDPATNDWKIFQHNASDEHSLPYNKATSVFEDSKGRLWITSQGGGFCLFDRESETFSTFNSLNGLPNDVVYQIVDDDEGTLWLSTNSGLVQFDPQKGTFKNYHVTNGLKTNQFNYQSSYKTSNGHIYFGSLDGFVRFNPSTFKESQSVAPLVLTDLFINNVRMTPSDNGSPIKQSILYTDRLSLPHHQNSLSLRYAVLNYSGSHTDRVFYRLEGLDKKWLQAADQQTIVYSNLKPGNYELLLGFAGEDGNEPVKSVKRLSIDIRPPFWLNGWAYLLYFLLLLTGIFFFTRFFYLRNRLREQERMRDFEQQKERELYRSKIDFFTNVAHEIRTPLSLIKAPLSHVIMTGQVSDEVKENLQIMSKNTDRLLNLTNQLLDFRKTESDAYSLNLHRINVSELIRDTFLRFTPLAKQGGVQFELTLPEKDIFIKVDKEAFLKILSNLLNNAVKYCESYVRVEAYTVTGEQYKQFHLVTVNDGEEIPEKYREDIFKPFVQVDRKKDHKVAGTGIGLALSKSLAELHKGDLVLEAEEESEWICFHLILPAGEVDEVLAETTGEPEKDKEAEKSKGKTTRTTAAATLLLVDDDLELLQFEEKFLSPHYHVVTAKNGIQALEILRETTVNLIVSDVMMPDMDGLEFTGRVKSDIEFSHIPVILLTAKVNVESRVQGFETGADAYIDKPFSLEVLMAQIANLLESREKLRETFLQNPFIGAGSIVQSKSDEEFIKKLHAIVQENLDNSDFIVEDIAEQFNMSRASFYRKIKGVLDLTPNEYIRVERLKKAAQLLKEKVYKVNEICYMVGFNSPSYFTKCFQQQFGILPKDFE